MTPRWDVLGFGAVAVDDLVFVDHHPLPDSKLPIRAFERHGGGLAGTALVAAARLGAKAAFGSVLGDDELSQYTINELVREGVDCSPVIHHPDARPHHSVVIVDQSTGQRCILFSGMGVMEMSEEQITDELIANCRVLFVDYTVVTSAAVAIEKAHWHGIPVIGDVENRSGVQLEPFVSQIDHLIIGTEAAYRLSGANNPATAVSKLSGLGRACYVVTAGKNGCWYSERGGQVRHVPALDVQVVDTTGCGDVFHGAYAASLARGESVDTAVRVATIAAGVKATRPGGRAGIPDRQVVDEFLKHFE